MNNELPLGAKPETTTDQKPVAPEIKPAAPATKPAKVAPKKSEPATNGPVIKSSPVNPAWATEVAKAYGCAGSLADAVAEKLVTAVAEHIGKVTSPARLTKLVREAANTSIGKF